MMRFIAWYFGLVFVCLVLPTILFEIERRLHLRSSRRHRS